jgi:hypothetical protein
MTTHPTRATEARAAQPVRPSFGEEYRGRLHFDPALIPDGLEAGWFRETTYGQRDDENLADAIGRRGFRPATVQDIPQLARPDFGMATLRDKAADGIIRRGSDMLMLRDKQIGIEERAYFARTAQQNVQSAARASRDPVAQMDGELYREISETELRQPRVRVETSRGGGKFAE